MDIDYAGMHAGVLAAWLLIATGAGYLARRLTRGRSILGLWGDAAVGLVGIFLMGTLFRAFDFDLAVMIFSWAPDNFDLAIWLDIATTAIIGALLLRAMLRVFGGARS